MGYPISFVTNLWGRLFRPFMIYGYWNFAQKSFKKNTRYSSTTVFLDKSKIDIADDCWIGPNCILDGSGRLQIGEGVQIAGLTAIFTHSSHLSIRLCGKSYIFLDQHERSGYVRKSVVIGNFSFIGISSVILPGVVVGKGCVIAAGSVLKISVPDFSIVAGNPAKVIGSTLDMDKEYLKDLSIKNSYFDPLTLDKYK